MRRGGILLEKKNNPSFLAELEEEKRASGFSAVREENGKHISSGLGLGADKKRRIHLYATVILEGVLCVCTAYL